MSNPRELVVSAPEQEQQQKLGTQPELARPPEQRPTEAAFEQYKQIPDEQRPDESPYVIRQAATRQPTDQVMTDDAQKSPVQIEIENIMADGLEAPYRSMTPEQQEKFRKKGEEVAKAIENMITHVKLTARKVLHLIREWLKLIPGVNRYFLEQEAKLKTDEIMKYGREKLLKKSYND